MKTAPFRTLLLLSLCAFCAPLLARAQWPAAYANSTIPQSALLQPDALNQLLGSTKAQKPLLLHVGSHVLFAQAHIPGSVYIGPGATPAGLAALETYTAKLPRTTPIVLYCGCCPWQRCPNLGPAFAKLQMMGFPKVQVLYIANNLGADWVAKGYKVEQGQ